MEKTQHAQRKELHTYNEQLESLQSEVSESKVLLILNQYRYLSCFLFGVCVHISFLHWLRLIFPVQFDKLKESYRRLQHHQHRHSTMDLSNTFSEHSILCKKLEIRPLIQITSHHDCLMECRNAWSKIDLQAQARQIWKDRIIVSKMAGTIPHIIDSSVELSSCSQIIRAIHTPVFMALQVINSF